MQGLLGSKNLMKWFQKNFISLHWWTDPIEKREESSRDEAGDGSRNS